MSIELSTRRETEFVGKGKEKEKKKRKRKKEKKPKKKKRKGIVSYKISI